MIDEYKQWTIPGEVFQQCLQNLPDGFTLKVMLEADAVRPYITLEHEELTLWASDGPNVDESLVDCIGRLVQLAMQEGDDE